MKATLLQVEEITRQREARLLRRTNRRDKKRKAHKRQDKFVAKVLLISKQRQIDLLKKYRVNKQA